MKNRIISISLAVVLALSIGLIGCGGEEVPEIPEYNLAISSTEGGEVTSPGEGTFTYDEGTVVDLVAQPDEGCQFMKWIGNVGAIADVYDAETTITMNHYYYITANFAIQMWDWYDLDAIRDNLDGSYVLMNDLDSTTAGYTELASPTANGEKGWEPIGSLLVDPSTYNIIGHIDPFTGSLDGQGYEIRDLFIGRPEEDGVGLFGCVGGRGVVENLGIMNVAVAGRSYVGVLVGENRDGTVSNSCSTGSVTGSHTVGGLVGWNWGTVSDSYSTGNATGSHDVGGLVGCNYEGTVSNSYSTGSVIGKSSVGGLIGSNHRYVTVSNSYYSYDEVLINGKNMITIGALSNEDFDQWLANDKFLDVNERLSQKDGYYLIDDVSDFKQLLAFGQDGSLKFRLKNDLDLATEPDFYIPYLAGEFDGDGHKISNLRLNFNFVEQVGLFGYLASGGKVSEVGVENVNVTGTEQVGGLVGFNEGSVSNSYSTGSVTGGSAVGGLVGWNEGTVSNSYSSGSVTGSFAIVGGLTGRNWGTVSNSYSTGSVTAAWGVGGLVGQSGGTVSNSFWDTETSGQATSYGGTGKTTGELKNIATFSGWSIIAVANPSKRNTAYTWNIVDGVTYPFLSWQL